MADIKSGENKTLINMSHKIRLIVPRGNIIITRKSISLLAS